MASCPWRPPGRGLCLCFQSGGAIERCRSRSGRGLAAGSGTLGRGGQPGIGPRSCVGWAAGQPSFSPSKQAKLRQGFYWCVPATFSNRFAWTKPWVDQFQLLSPARRKHCGLVFDMRGRPWSRLESVRATQDEFRAVLEEPSLLTSYSWRRLGTTVGLLANFSVPQLAALGDQRHSGQNACALLLTLVTM